MSISVEILSETLYNTLHCEDKNSEVNLFFHYMIPPFLSNTLVRNLSFKKIWKHQYTYHKHLGDPYSLTSSISSNFVKHHIRYRGFVDFSPTHQSERSVYFLKIILYSFQQYIHMYFLLICPVCIFHTLCTTSQRNLNEKLI